MNTEEFKAWFEGYTENMDSTPNEKQWKRIKKQVSEIDGTAITYPIFRERYVQRYPDWFTRPYTTWGDTGDTRFLCSTTAMNEVGKLEYKSGIPSGG